jgi:hypothetical protein
MLLSICMLFLHQNIKSIDFQNTTIERSDKFHTDPQTDVATG